MFSGNFLRFRQAGSAERAGGGCRVEERNFMQTRSRRHWLYMDGGELCVENFTPFAEL